MWSDSKGALEFVGWGAGVGVAGGEASGERTACAKGWRLREHGGIGRREHTAGPPPPMALIL